MEENHVPIPEGWKSYVGNEILNVQGGYAFKSDDYKDEGVLLVRIGNIGNGNFIFKDVIYIPNRFQLTHSNFQLWKGDVLMGLTGDLGKICILRNGNFPYFLNQRVGRFILTDKIDNEYLFYLISSSFIQSKFDAFFAGGAQKNISPKQIESINYLIPESKDEQRKIASILSKLDEAITQTEQLIEKYKKIKEGLMHDLLTRGIDEQGNIRSEETHKFKDSPLGRIPEKWEYGSLSTIYELRTGTTPLRANENYFSEKGYNWAKTLDLNEYYINSTEEKVTDLALERTSLKLMPKDTILVAMYGGWEQIGRTSILNVEAGTNQAIVSLCNPKIQLQAEFTLFFLQENRWRWKQYAVSTRKDPNITKDDVANFIIAHPKCEKEQKDIVIIIQKVHNQIDLYKEQYLKYNLQKSGLMHDLLTGKIRVQI